MDLNKKFLLLYGSQTGQAQAIAEQIRDYSLRKGLEADLHCLDKSEKEFCLEKEQVFVVVVSTTGDGDPPDNVIKFWRKLKKKTLPSNHLASCNFALLGLGDTNYSNFCNMGKKLNKRLLELGARHFYPPGYADDGVGLDIVVEPWIEGLWDPLMQVLTLGSNPNDSPECGTELGQAIITGDTSPKIDKIETGKAPLGGRSGRIEADSTDVLASNFEESVNITASSSSSDNIDCGGHETPGEFQVKGQVPITGTGISDDRTEMTKLRTSSSPIDTYFTLPSLSAAYVKVELRKIGDKGVPDFPHSSIRHGINTPPVSMATILGSRLLTKEGSKKRTLEVELMVPGVQYEPGDAFGFVCGNAADETLWLLQRLKLVEDNMMDLSILSETTKRNPVLPMHIPKSCSVKQFFTYCADFRAVPKKAHLCLLSSFCSNPKEERRLQELSSRQGSMEYSSLFIEERTNFLDLLCAFPSCQPPLGRIIEILPKLQPRYYSAASSPLSSPGKLKIAFNVEQLPARLWQSEGLGRERSGLASGWIDRAAAQVQLTGINQKVPIFPRLLNPFHLPDDHSHSIVMIGPGTGVSPFMGFLQHREAQLNQFPSLSKSFGKTWLFFGCRNPDTDHLYKEEMEHYLDVGCLTYLHVVYSQTLPSKTLPSYTPIPLPTTHETPPSSDLATPTIVTPGDNPPETPPGPENSPLPPPLRYVQDVMRLTWKELGSWIVKEKALVYVCGDAKNMAKDVNAALLEVVEKYISSPISSSSSSDSPEELIRAMKEEGRYLVDAWS